MCIHMYFLLATKDECFWECATILCSKKLLMARCISFTSRILIDLNDTQNGKKQMKKAAKENIFVALLHSVSWRSNYVLQIHQILSLTQSRAPSLLLVTSLRVILEKAVYKRKTLKFSLSDPKKLTVLQIIQSL